MLIPHGKLLMFLTFEDSQVYNYSCLASKWSSSTKAQIFFIKLYTEEYVMRYAIWYYMHNFKNVKTPMEECYF